MSEQLPEPYVPVDPVYRAKVWRRIIAGVFIGNALLASAIVYFLI